MDRLLYSVAVVVVVVVSDGGGGGDGGGGHCLLICSLICYFPYSSLSPAYSFQSPTCLPNTHPHSPLTRLHESSFTSLPTLAFLPPWKYIHQHAANFPCLLVPLRYGAPHFYAGGRRLRAADSAW